MGTPDRATPLRSLTERRAQAIELAIVVVATVGAIAGTILDTRLPWLSTTLLALLPALEWWRRRAERDRQNEAQTAADQADSEAAALRRNRLAYALLEELHDNQLALALFLDGVLPAYLVRNEWPRVWDEPELPGVNLAWWSSLRTRTVTTLSHEILEFEQLEPFVAYLADVETIESARGIGERPSSHVIFSASLVLSRMVHTADLVIPALDHPRTRNAFVAIEGIRRSREWFQVLTGLIACTYPGPQSLY